MLFNLVLLIVAAAVPGLAWLIFFLNEDVHPEPRKLVLYTFGVGVLIAVPVVAIQLIGRNLLYSIAPYMGILIFFLAGVEEIMKSAAAYLAVGGSDELDEPVDYMIYMIAAGLGLATIENFFILSEYIFEGGLEALAEVTNLMTLRFIGATFLHALASGLVGYYWAMSEIKSQKKTLLFGFFYATLVHGFFNGLVLVFQPMDHLIYPSLFLLIAGVVLFKDFEKLKDLSSAD